MSERVPLLKKLGVKPESRVRLVNPPDLFRGLFDEQIQSTDVFDVALAFCFESRDVSLALVHLRPDLAVNGGIWLAWPKKASGMKTDCSDQVVRTVGLETGLVDNKVCAIDATWSALRFVVRTKDRGS